MKCGWRWKGVTEGEDYQEVGRARVNMVLGAGIITLVLLSLVIFYIPSAHGDGIVWETYIEDVPFRYQSLNYYCGPASLEMVFHFYGIDINQYYIADVTRTTNITGTGGWDILRAGHFSNLSSSIGDVYSYFDCSGYPGRDLGYASFHWSSVDQNFTESVNYLYDLIDEGYPIIVSLWPDLTNTEFPSALMDTGHCVVVVGYGSTTNYVIPWPMGDPIAIVTRWIRVHDPWNAIEWNGVGGPDRIIGLDDFNATWRSYNYSMYFIHPWMVNVTGVSVNTTSTFVVTANVTYPCPAPFSRDEYPASSSTATIDLPRSFSLAPGENLTKTVGSGGVMTAGNSSTISWNVTAPSEASSYELEVEAEGMVNEMDWNKAPSMQPLVNYTYTDRIGGSGLGSVTVRAREFEPTETPAETTGEETLDSSGVAKTSFAAGETVLASSTITNTGNTSQSMVIAVQWTDSELRALAPSFMLTTLAPGADLTYAAGLVVPATGFAAGEWTAKINVYDAWPAQGGNAIGTPVTITFTVTS